jgi:hypothetical protein
VLEIQQSIVLVAQPKINVRIIRDIVHGMKKRMYAIKSYGLFLQSFKKHNSLLSIQSNQPKQCTFVQSYIG